MFAFVCSVVAIGFAIASVVVNVRTRRRLRDVRRQLEAINTKRWGGPWPKSIDAETPDVIAPRMDWGNKR